MNAPVTTHPRKRAKDIAVGDKVFTGLKFWFANGPMLVTKVEITRRNAVVQYENRWNDKMPHDQWVYYEATTA